MGRDKEKWFKEIAKRCPWYDKQDKSCSGINTHGLGGNCHKVNCAPFFMAATIISAYKDNKSMGE